MANIIEENVMNVYTVTLENEKGDIVAEVVLADSKRNAIVNAKNSYQDETFIAIDVDIKEDVSEIIYVKGE